MSFIYRGKFNRRLTAQQRFARVLHSEVSIGLPDLEVLCVCPFLIHASSMNGF